MTMGPPPKMAVAELSIATTSALLLLVDLLLFVDLLFFVDLLLLKEVLFLEELPCILAHFTLAFSPAFISAPFPLLSLLLVLLVILELLVALLVFPDFEEDG